MNKAGSNNLTAKILSLVLAAILWIYVMNEQNPPIEAVFAVPVEVRNSQQQLVPDDIPETVRVKLRGPRSVIAGVLAKDIICYVDVKGLSEGRHSVKVATVAPTGLEIIETNPDRAAIRLDAVIQRRLPLEFRLTGTAQPGAVISRITGSQEQVRIEGARPLVDNVDKVYVPVEISNRSTDFQLPAPVIPVNKAGQTVEGLTLQPDKVNVAVTIAKENIRKLVAVRVLTSGEPAKGYVVKSVTTEPAQVEVWGMAEDLERLDFVTTEPVSVSAASQDVKRDVLLEIKDGLKAEPSSVRVTIQLTAK